MVDMFSELRPQGPVDSEALRGVLPAPLSTPTIRRQGFHTNLFSGSSWPSPSLG